MASSPTTPSSMFPRFLSFAYGVLIFSSFCHCRRLQDSLKGLTLDSVRDFLTREEDTIVFSLIERAKYPYNSPTYDPSYLHGKFSLVEIFVRETQAVQAKAGRYQNPEEIPFFPNNLPLSTLAPPYKFPQVLYPAAASVNVTKTIWTMYFNDLLSLFTTRGNDGNYALTAASDLVCLQALSRRIHYGRFVAEAKYRDAPQDYNPAIRAQDKDALMKLLTSESQEELVKRRVKKKAMVFGQDITLDENDTGDSNSNRTNYKVDPSIAYHLYGDWVIPLTKLVEVEYLLHRLD
ncbi:chorismate mutase 2-like [Phoenix dactylifera]|uniref:Chorismate mutase n=1 Tax=Phoenix dactylifera TaxID=42345 RepID=A0A8B8ZLE0_PHODC|nr:chorismate mutase 2-like [Phoenix dactylifera]